MDLNDLHWVHGSLGFGVFLIAVYLAAVATADTGGLVLGQTHSAFAKSNSLPGPAAVAGVWLFGSAVFWLLYTYLQQLTATDYSR